MGGIFVSYRRKDSDDITGRICDRLKDRFGAANVFKDSYSIPKGADFQAVIANALTRASAALIVIGPTWTTIAEGRRRRLDDPQDTVRAEVEAALSNPSITVFPVLVKDARMPSKRELPSSISRLADIQATVVRGDPDFDGDIVELGDAVAAIVPAVGSAGVTRVEEFHDIEWAIGVGGIGAKYLLQGPLKRGKFEYFTYVKALTSFSADIPWPKSVEAMWQACQRVDPAVDRVLGYKGAGTLVAVNGAMEFSFVSSSFRVKVSYHFQSHVLQMKVESQGTMTITARDPRIADAVVEQYRRLAPRHGG